MKRLSGKIKAALTNRRGETLMECVVSLLILSVLLTTVGTMIQVSLSITRASTLRAEEMQNSANDASLAGSGSPDKILKLESANGIDVEIPVKYFDDGTFEAFAP